MGHYKKTIDLHAITRTYGVANVAKVLGIKGETLAHKRAGHRRMSLKELYLLGLAYPEMDLSATVRRVGAAACAKDPNLESFD